MLEKLNLGLKKVTIPLPFALDHVHCFIAEGENGSTVIDTGLHNKETSAIWRKELESTVVNRIILTHHHPDHIGYAGMVQQKTHAPVWMSERDSRDLQTMWSTASLPRLAEDYRKSAVPEKIATGILDHIEQFPPYVTPLPEINHYLQDGEKIRLGNLEYEVIFTPGHAAGLVCFFNHEKSVLLSTDHILPKITPNVAYWFYGESNPLQSFENSLKRMKQFDAEYVIPSHGEPFKGANQRIDEIWQHHEERLNQTMDAAKNSVTVFDMCHVLFKREFSVHDYQFAIGETIAHLEYLVHKGMLERELIDGQWYYRYRY